MGRYARATTYSVVSRVDRSAGLRICAIIALGCVELIVGGVTYGELHWPQAATQALQLPVYAAMLHLMSHAVREQMARWTGRPGGSPVPAGRHRG